MSFRLVPVDTMSGDPIIPEVPCVEASWTRTMSSIGVGRGRFTIPTAQLSRGVVQRLIDKQATTLVPEFMFQQTDGRFGGIAEYAGICQRYRWRGDALEFDTTELAGMLLARHLFGVSPGPVTRDITGESWGHVLRQVIRYALSDTGSSTWDFPIDFPGYRTGPIRRKVEWWRFERAQDITDEVVTETGSTFDLHPTWADGALRWILRINETAGDIRMVASTTEHRVIGGCSVEEELDYSKLRTGIFAVGEGEESKLQYGSAGSSQVAVSTTGPRLDSSVSWTNISDKKRLNSLARGELMRTAKPIRKWSLVIKCGDGNSLHPWRFQPGTELLVEHPGDKVVGAGRYSVTCLEVERDMTNVVRIVGEAEKL